MTSTVQIKVELFVNAEIDFDSDEKLRQKLAEFKDAVRRDINKRINSGSAFFYEYDIGEPTTNIDRDW